MMGITISANGRYVAGSDTEGRAFIYDTQAKQIKYFQSPNLGNADADLDDQASIRSVTNDGVGYGDIYGESRLSSISQQAQQQLCSTSR